MFTKTSYDFDLVSRSSFHCDLTFFYNVNSFILLILFLLCILLWWIHRPPHKYVRWGPLCLRKKKLTAIIRRYTYFRHMQSISKFNNLPCSYYGSNKINCDKFPYLRFITYKIHDRLFLYIMKYLIVFRLQDLILNNEEITF